MGSYLERRGKQVEPLFGLLDAEHRRLAMLPTTASRDVRLAAGEDGLVRCRLGGLPALLAPVTPTLHLDLVSLAALWPRWASELVERAGEDAARDLFAGKVVLEPSITSERVQDLILAHQIRAEHLYFLGERPAPRAVPSIERFTLRFESGTLGLALDRAGFEHALAERRLAPDAAMRVTWNDVDVTLPSASLPWHDEELAELAIVATMQIQGAAQGDVLALLEQALPDRGVSLPPSVALGSILNVWGVARRQKQDLPGAIALLTRAHAFAADVDAQLEQQVAYNLGYAKLQTTMATRTPLGKQASHDLVHATYDVAPENRALWAECLALFERALALAPTDATARSQRDQTRTLLGLLEGAKPAPAAPARTKPRATGRVTKPAEPESWLNTWGVTLTIAGVFAAICLAVILRHERDTAPTTPAPPHVAAAAAPSPPADTVSPRMQALAGLGATPLATSETPCPFSVALPEDIAPGEVSAPLLGRAGTGELYGTEYFDATIRAWAAQHAPTLDVHTIDHLPIGPVHDEDGPSGAWTRAPYRTTLIVTAWQDPVVQGASILPGRVEGQLVIWSMDDQRFACATPVDAANGAHLSLVRSADLTGDEDDPLNRARLDLVEQAVRTGIPMLRAVVE